ncbi:hypothetical protein MMC25_005801 [Agyrium rufum]|nr:hypothetical protein [Agyrium rufum]
MSMPAWPNDLSTAPPTENGAYMSSTDPSMGYMSTPTSNAYDFGNHIQNRPLQQSMQNGHMRNGSPGFINPGGYQTQSVVPAKRPRPRDDVYSASPQATPGTLPLSRSQTPQQTPYTPFQNSINGLPPNQSSLSYPHMQHGTPSNTSPSPIMHEQHYGHPGVPQRMQTASPSPFSPMIQQYASQGSPPHSDYGGRVEAPQNGTNTYMQGMPYGSVPGQPYSSSNLGQMSNGGMMGAPNYANHAFTAEQQRKAMEMRQQQQQQQQQHVNRMRAGTQDGSMPSHSQVPGMNAMPQSYQGANYQQSTRPQQPSTPQQLAAKGDQFMKKVAHFMAQRQQPFQQAFYFGGRLVSAAQIWGTVIPSGGSAKVGSTNQWLSVAAHLGFSPNQSPTVGTEMRNYWNLNLFQYEQFFIQTAQQQRDKARAAVQQPQLSPQFQARDPTMGTDPFSPVKPLHSQHPEPMAMAHPRRPSHGEFQAPGKPIPSQQPSPHLNGFSNAHPPNMLNHQPPGYPMVHPTAPAPGHPHPHRTSFSTPAAVKKESQSSTAGNFTPSQSVDMPRISPMDAVYSPKYRDSQKTQDGIESHGGIQVTSFSRVIDQLLEFMPVVPTMSELGVIDIRALTMSLRSGIHAEVRLALDTLASISREPILQSFGECEELVEALVDCAGDQVDLLADNTIEVSDAMLITPYEEVFRGCRAENEALEECPEFGTLEYDLDRSVERLICITTIIRNLSFIIDCRSALKDAQVVRMMTSVIRYLGTRNMLLRTCRNSLDFYKDVVIYLSNLSDLIDLPGKEETACILNFLLSFAPSPGPHTSKPDEVMFSSFTPSSNPYLPPALDSFAKLLARDPNRVYFRSVIAADSSSSPPYDILTRSFAMAISPIPEPGSGPSVMKLVESRKPFLAQGMLAGEILVSLIPSSEHTIAKMWLNSCDGFATTLLQIVAKLNEQSAALPQKHGGRVNPIESDSIEASGYISVRGLGILRRLAERAREGDELIDEQTSFFNFSAGRDLLLETLTKSNVDLHFLKQLSTFVDSDFLRGS